MPPSSRTQRPLLDDDERAALLKGGALSVDRRRSRARYFDGRFLTAGDLTGDQDYVVHRHIDLGQAVGWGVVEGAVVRVGKEPRRVTVTPGLGVTPAGETLVVSEEVTVDLIALRDDALRRGYRRGGLGRGRTSGRGVFALALVPVEHRSSPRQGYPTKTHGGRPIEPHWIEEGAELALSPWPVQHSGGPRAVRRRLVRDVFLGNTPRTGPANQLPLALVYLSGTEIEWVDADLAWRHLGSDRLEGGLGLGSRALRVAHVRQYRQQLREILRQGTHALAATDHFDLLPPVGELPCASLDAREMSQRFFPPDVQVDVALVPEPELPALVDDGLMLPPIDLTGDLRGTSVLVALPVDPGDARDLRRSLASAGSGWSAAVAHAVRRLGPRALGWYVRRRNIAFGASVPGFVAEIDLLDLPEPALPELFERRVVATAKDDAGDITALVNPHEPWERISTAEAITQIEAGTHAYYVLRGGVRTDVRVVRGPTRKYLRTDPDVTGRNNLDNLPDA